MEENSYSWYNSPRNVFLLAAVVLFLFIQILYGMPVPMHYVFIISSMAIVLLSGTGGRSFNWACGLFLAAMIISILGNDIPVFFKPWQRFALFAMLMVGCSPMIRDAGVDKVKRNLATGAMWALGAVALASFAGYFLGFGQYMTGIVNSYMGITGHANFLGFFTMVAMVWFGSLFFRSTEMKERVFFGGAWAACTIVLLLASSRSALAGGLAGTIIVVYLRFQKNASKMMTSILIGMILVIMALPHLMVYTEALMKKDLDFEDSETMLAATRGSIWDLRYKEIAESPLIGVGAYSCDTSLPFADTFYTESTGTIELGSSYLGLLSQCGWLGFIAFLLIVLPIIRKTYRYATKERTPYAQLWLPMLFVVASNMIFEGYLTTAGAVQCIVVWLVLAAADQCDTVADYPVFWEKEDPITPDEYEYWRENIAEDGDVR